MKKNITLIIVSCVGGLLILLCSFIAIFNVKIYHANNKMIQKLVNLEKISNYILISDLGIKNRADLYRKVSINLLEIFHKFTLKHNIQYSLADGNLIGFGRHNKKFLPWDEDLDTVMTMDNYKKMRKVIENFAKANNLIFITYKFDENLSDIEPGNLYSAQLCVKHETSTNQDAQICIDIFTLEWLKNDITKQKMEKVIFLQDKLFKLRQKHLNHAKTLKAFRKYSNYLKNEIISNEPSEYFGLYSFWMHPYVIKSLSFRKIFFKKSVFYPLQKTTFENIDANVMNDWYSYISAVYNDEYWMENIVISDYQHIRLSNISVLDLKFLINKTNNIIKHFII